MSNNYNWRRPTAASTVDVPRDIINLAEDADSTVKSVTDGIAGRVTTIENRPLCVLEKSLVQSVPDNAFTILTFDIETFDNSGMHVAGNTSRMTATVAGYYLLNGAVHSPNNATGVRRAAWLKNGATGVGATVTTLPASGYTWAVNLPSMVARLNVGEYVEVNYSHTIGGPMNVTNAWASAIYICP